MLTVGCSGLPRPLLASLMRVYSSANNLGAEEQFDRGEPRRRGSSGVQNLGTGVVGEDRGSLPESQESDPAFSNWFHIKGTTNGVASATATTTKAKRLSIGASFGLRKTLDAQRCPLAASMTVMAVTNCAFAPVLSMRCRTSLHERPTDRPGCENTSIDN